ncbi:MAG: hypothetical protein M3Q65_03280 [Chloroflexota bacterium]|nr:hypothetical protein [Chloroflexota bacterium]
MSYPSGEPPPGGFWIPDQPEARPPRAFGVLPPEPLARRPAVREYALAAALPSVPPGLPVYLGGRYPDSYQAVFDRVVRRGESAWTFGPQFSSVWYPEDKPLEDAAIVGDAPAAERRAAQLLAERSLLPSDAKAATTTARAGGPWMVMFLRHRAGLAVYSKSNLTTLAQMR